MVMKKMWKLGGRRKPQRTDSRRALMEDNKEVQDGCGHAGKGQDGPSAQDTFNTNEQQLFQISEEVTLQKLAELLGVACPDITFEDGSCISIRPETISGQQDVKQSVVRIIQRSVSQRFPKQPADLDQNLQRHLLNVQETVRDELVKLAPLLDSMGLMGCLIDCYHRQTIDHLSDLLQNTRSSRNSLVLMKWVLHTYLSQELLDHPDLREMDPIKKVDFLLFTEWVAKANDKLLENVQEEVSGFLEKILQLERRQEGDCDEAYVGLYVDTIQCIDAMPKEAQRISSELSDHVRAVCFQELLTFVRRYTAEQTEILEKEAKLDKPETTHFFKTLNSCEKLKQHVQTSGEGVRRSLLQETVDTLEHMEAFTLKLVLEMVADLAESHLKNYFKMENKQFLSLIVAVQACFPKLSWCQDIQKRVMDKAYKRIAHIYLKHLVRSSQKRLAKCWSPDVGRAVAADAAVLHNTISDLAPGVQQWNLLLLRISELLECKGIDVVKLTVASMQKDCPTWSEDQDLLPALLRWKGLSRCQVREVLDALPGQEPKPRSTAWFSCFGCC
ncbi:exocyst complex component 3 [Chelmon rostratus]|uniref:exocyst complex component 3 n=1 Tax=Chelmon rostratus TaxID=109905 RepID=UPI001BE763B5|nr:exocyst complex component 3 [Chelmon rostratus]